MSDYTRFTNVSKRYCWACE